MSSNTPNSVSSITNGIKKNTFLKKHGLKIAVFIFIVVVLAVIFRKQITNFFKPEDKKPQLVISATSLTKKNPKNNNKVENYENGDDAGERDLIELTKNFAITVTLNITMFGEFIDELRIKRTGGNLTEPDYEVVEPDVDGNTPYTDKAYTVEFKPLDDEIMLGDFEFEIEYKNPANTTFTKVGTTYSLAEITPNEISLTDKLGEYPLAVNAEAGPVTAIADFSKKETRFYMESDDLDLLENSDPYYLAPIKGRESSFRVLYMNDTSAQLSVYELEGTKIAIFETSAMKKTPLWNGKRIFSFKLPGLKDFTKLTSSFYLRDVNGKKLIALDIGGDIYNSPNPEILLKGEIQTNGNQILEGIKSLLDSNNIKYLLAKELREISGGELMTRGFINVEKDEELKRRELAGRIDPASVKLRCEGEDQPAFTPDSLGNNFINYVKKYAVVDDNMDERKVFCGKDGSGTGNPYPGIKCGYPGAEGTYTGWYNFHDDIIETIPMCTSNGKRKNNHGISFNLIGESDQRVYSWSQPLNLSKTNQSPPPSAPPPAASPPAASQPTRGFISSGGGSFALSAS